MKLTAKLLLAIVALPLLTITSTAQAGSVTLTLKRVRLTNVDDAAGRNQIEAGQVLKGATQVATYTITRRVSTDGTTAQNEAAEDITILFLPLTVKPAQNITLRGVHDFNNGGAIGSVAAASSLYDWIRSASYTKTAVAGVIGSSYLSLSWNGANTLTLP